MLLGLSELPSILRRLMLKLPKGLDNLAVYGDDMLFLTVYPNRDKVEKSNLKGSTIPMLLRGDNPSNELTWSDSLMETTVGSAAEDSRMLDEQMSSTDFLWDRDQESEPNNPKPYPTETVDTFSADELQRFLAEKYQSFA
ncbi:hypothetical protein P879_01223 [Paragonimus westermani]|uniref:Uncharacterized protein n=1 Tax=Paragonimus westermani TaxID=34504 RepID=A0A8T0DX45_9TREM|nr:hypothetical protein P879_01223 [Paragonimus westermani]